MDIDEYFPTLGLEPVPGLATAYPELARSLAALYGQRMAKLSFLPASWLNTALAEHGQGGVVLYPTPTTMRDGTVKENLPPWLRTAEAREVWDKISAEATAAVTAYARRDQAAGALRLSMLQANAAFWDWAYRTQKQVREGLSSLFGGAGLMVVLGLVAYSSLKQRGRK